MSPRSVRDLAAIEVTFPDGQPVGSALPEQGGGPLRGGRDLQNRVVAEVTDPVLPYAITITVAAHDGFLVCEQITVAQRPDGPVMTSAAVRSIGLSLYLQRIRQELPRTAWLGANRIEGDGFVSFDLPFTEPSGWDAFAQMRKATRITPEIAAAAYLEALGSPDPERNRRPTAAAAEALGVSRGYMSGLITEARKKGIEGLGAGRPARRKRP